MTPELNSGDIAWVAAAAALVMLMKLMNLLSEIRVSREEEAQGLDLSQRGEEAYN